MQTTSYWDEFSESRGSLPRRSGVGASSALDVMDRLEAFVASTQQLEQALKKERERSTAFEAQVNHLTQQLATFVDKERKANEAGAQERLQREAEKRVFDEKLKKMSGQYEIAKGQIAFLSGTLSQHKKLWEQLRTKEQPTPEMVHENRALSERLKAAEIRAAGLEKELKEERARADRLVGLVENVENATGGIERVTGNVTMLTGELGRKIDALEKKLQEQHAQRLEAPVVRCEDGAAEIRRGFGALANWLAKAMEKQSRVSALQLDNFAKAIEVLGQRLESSQKEKKQVVPPPPPRLMK